MDVETPAADAVHLDGFPSAVTPGTAEAAACPSSGECTEERPPSVDLGSDCNPQPEDSVDTAKNDEGTEERLNQMFNELAEFMEAYSEPRLASPAWSFLDFESRLRIDMEPSEFLQSLEKQFDAEFLLVLGLLERDGDNLRPASFVSGDPPLYMEIDRQKHTLRIYHDSNLLFPISRTAMDCALERRSPGSPADTQCLFVTSSADDVEVLRALGLTAVTADGLEILRHSDIAQIFPEEQRVDAEWRYFLVLLDFDVAGLENEPSAAIADVICRLADVAEAYPIDPGRRFGLCRPTDREFNDLHLATTFKDRNRIRQLLQGWAEKARKTNVDNWRFQGREQQMSYSAASSALRRALEQKDVYSRRRDVAAALPAYKTACQESVIAKFHRAVDETTDLFEQFELIAATSYAEKFFESDPLLYAAEAVMSGKDPGSVRERQDKLFQQRQQCVTELSRLHRARKSKR